MLKDIIKQNLLDDLGFTKLDSNVLNIEEIQMLKSLISDSKARNSTLSGFDVGLELANKSIVENINLKIVEIVLPKLLPHLLNCEMFIASHLGKDSNINSIVLPHQDWTFIEDEENNYSFSCWIPLSDVDFNNGCMGFIKRTHKIFNDKRASPAALIPQSINEHLFTLMPFIETIYMKAGECLIFNNKTLHASLPNIKKEYRDAVAIVFTKTGTNFRHFYLKPGTSDTLLEYEINKDFFLKYDNKILLEMYNNNRYIDDYQLIREVKYKPKEYTKNEIVRVVKEAGNIFNKDIENLLRSNYTNNRLSTKIFKFSTAIRNIFSFK
ncbi:MAG: phytanoyl-CoA dioxygenase family protein [Chitinophagales bacterium]